MGIIRVRGKEGFFDQILGAWRNIQGFSLYEWIGIIFVGIILSLTLLIAVLSLPNNFDSLTYHMARVAEWIQHQSVRFFSTAIPRQNHAMPLAEYAILHLQILSRSDRFANLVQWAIFSTSIVVVSLFTKELNVSRSGQIFVSVLVAALPMAILQSLSTQNDLVAGVFCSIFAYFLMRTTKTLNLVDALFASLSMGLALLMKVTAYIYCAGISLGIGGGALLLFYRGRQKKVLFGLFNLIILGGLFINSGHYVRNFNLYNHPLSTANSRITVDRISFGNTAANFIRNTAIHLGVPYRSYNEGLTKTFFHS